MKLHFKIDLYEFDNPSLTGQHYIEFHEVENPIDWNVNETDCISLDIDGSDREVDMWYAQSGAGASYTNHFDDLSTNGRWIEFDANITDGLSELPYFITENIIQVTPVGNSVLVWLYTQNSENDVLSKSLTFVNIIAGQFNSAFNLKNPVLDLHITDSGNIACNYIYIPSLSRYYYVESVDVISANYIRYKLREDVLMTWQSLIRQQSAFVTRCENENNKDVLIDERLPTYDKISYSLYSPNNSAFKNVTFDYLQYDADEINNYNILINTYTQDLYTSLDMDYIDPPAYYHGLPQISPLRSRQNLACLVNIGGYKGLINACVKDDTTASYVASAIWLPFKADDVFTHIQSGVRLHANNKVLDGVDGGKWVNYGSEVNHIPCTWIHDGACPYLILADFTFNSTGGVTPVDNSAGIEIYKPYSKWEIYVPFVSWVEVDINQVRNKRILVYYAMDMETGLSTAYIYNYTDGIVLFSATCQIGIRLSITTTNEIENTKQKQANDTNMILGALSSVLSIGVGVASENPVAIAGGVLSAGKTIAGYVNANNQIFDRANISFGGSISALYSPNEVKIRRSYHYPIAIDDDVYGHINGYPANIYQSLSIFSGYTEIGEIHFDPKNELIAQDEISEIVTLLKDGVIL